MIYVLYKQFVGRPWAHLTSAQVTTHKSWKRRRNVWKSLAPRNTNVIPSCGDGIIKKKIYINPIVSPSRVDQNMILHTIVKKKQVHGPHINLSCHAHSGFELERLRCANQQRPPQHLRPSPARHPPQARVPKSIRYIYLSSVGLHILATCSTRKRKVVWIARLVYTIFDLLLQSCRSHGQRTWDFADDGQSSCFCVCWCFSWSFPWAYEIPWFEFSRTSGTIPMCKATSGQPRLDPCGSFCRSTSKHFEGCSCSSRWEGCSWAMCGVFQNNYGSIMLGTSHIFSIFSHRALLVTRLDL